MCKWSLFKGNEMTDRNNSLEHDTNVQHEVESEETQLWRSLRKEFAKFDKACRQLAILEQHINDLQNSFGMAVECDRKMFKILHRMQLATYEGTRNAYVEYIERQMEKIKRMRRLALELTHGIAATHMQPPLLIAPSFI